MSDETAQQPANILHVVVRGRVQGVGFRVFTHQAATRIGCTGWVRNLPDGAVELYAEGSEERLLDLLTEVSKGPPWSHVAEMDPEWKYGAAEHQEFRIRR